MASTIGDLPFTELRMTDEIVVSSWTPNRDGSITVFAQINVYGPDHQLWSKYVKLRLADDEDAGARTFARAKRREIDSGDE